MVLGKYVILDRIGSGSMGRVYKATHQLMGRVVALKIIAPEIVSNERAVARFYREMKLVGRLDHPNVVRAFDSDSINNILYIVMEYVQGKSLAQLLEGRPAAADRRRRTTPLRRPWASRMPTSRGSSTATSSRRTCC